MTDEKLEKAIFRVMAGGDALPKDIPVLFNPAEYTIHEEANYDDPKTDERKIKKRNYTGTKSRTLSMDLFFDTSEKFVLGKPLQKATDVSKKTMEFSRMTRVVGELHTPPFVCFIWGSLKFVGVIETLDTTYLLFDKSGMPVRAKMHITIQQIEEDRPYEEPFESPDRTKARQITEDNQIWNIAQAEYGDPDMWRVICQANGIRDPLHIPPGTVLKVPALD